MSLAVLGALLSAAAAVQKVRFADPGLEEAVREKLGNPARPIARTELLQISRLDASGRRIADLRGIEYLRQLVALDLSRNRIGDAAPLRSLRKLRELNLGGNGIRSLAALNFDALVGIPLRKLSLDGDRDLPTDSGLSDISLLGRFPSLEKLALADNHVADISPLSALTALRSLDLRGNRVADCSPLSRLTSLTKLDLRENDLSDLAPLSGLTGLTYLNLHSNARLRSLRPLQGLARLNTLILRSVPAGDEIGFLKNLTGLNRLNVRDCAIADFSVLGELMASGALQNDPAARRVAGVNVLDNPLPAGDRDPYLPIRPYWGKIAGRKPLVAGRKPFDLPPPAGRIDPPSFSRPGGFYDEPFDLRLGSDEPGAAIRYTLDGSSPKEQSARYASPLPIRAAPSPPGGFCTGTVVRAQAIAEDGRSSRVVTHTYWVDPSRAHRYTLPVFSLSTDMANLSNKTTGLFQYRNRMATGRFWERPVAIEFFETDGRRAFALNGGFRLHGGSSRDYDQKSLRLYARPEYGWDDAFRYPFFPGLKKRGSGEPLQEFKTLILSNASNDYRATKLRDVLMQGLVEHSARLDTQASRPVVVFLNGVYWGVYSLREFYDEHYLAGHYDGPPDRAVILKENALLKRGAPADRDPYLALREYARRHDLSDPANYRRVAGLMDLDNYLEYYAAEIYFHNSDWPHNNITFWRLKPEGDPDPARPGHDGRWRWMLHSTEYGFLCKSPAIRGINRRAINEFQGRFGSLNKPSANTLEWALQERDCRLQEEWPNLLFRKLIDNEEFRNAFINRLADGLNSSFAAERVIRRIDELEASLLPEMAEHIRRWPVIPSLEAWKSNVQVLRRFAAERPDHVRRHILDRFGLSGYARVTLRADPSEGHVRINGLSVTEGTPGIRRPEDWTGVYFRGVPIKIAAIPEKGYRFAGWEGTELKGAEITLVPEGDLELTARFEKDSRD